jgi:hypothetical protein
LFLRASERRWVFEIAVSLLPVPEEDRAGFASVVINRDDEVELKPLSSSMCFDRC